MSSINDSMLELEETCKNNADCLLFGKLADEYRKAGDAQKAIDICNKGLERFPQYITGRIILGRCHLEQENSTAAISEFIRVCRLDRRNQVALKMLADTFVQQGDTEKGGDIFAYLSHIYPDNESLAHMASSTQASGKEDIFEILGTEATPPKELQSAPSTLADSGNADVGGMEMPAAENNTGAEDLLAASPVSQPKPVDTTGEPIDEVEVLEPVVQEDEFEVIETVDDLAGTENDDDISNRMNMIFDESARTAEPEADTTPAQSKEPDISGVDISNRIDDLFGATQSPAESRPEGLDTQKVENIDEGDDTETEKKVAEPQSEQSGIDISDTEITGEDISSRLEELFGSEPVKDQKPSMPAGLRETRIIEPEQSAQPEPGIREVKEGDDITGSDVTSRLDEMFADESVSDDTMVFETQTVTREAVEDASTLATQDRDSQEPANEEMESGEVHFSEPSTAELETKSVDSQSLEPEPVLDEMPAFQETGEDTEHLPLDEVNHSEEDLQSEELAAGQGVLPGESQSQQEDSFGVDVADEAIDETNLDEVLANQDVSDETIEFELTPEKQNDDEPLMEEFVDDVTQAFQAGNTDTAGIERDAMQFQNIGVDQDEFDTATVEPSEEKDEYFEDQFDVTTEFQQEGMEEDQGQEKSSRPEGETSSAQTDTLQDTLEEPEEADAAEPVPLDMDVMEEVPNEVSGQDIADRLDQILGTLSDDEPEAEDAVEAEGNVASQEDVTSPDNAVGGDFLANLEVTDETIAFEPPGETLENIPDEEDEEEVSQGFYTVSGEQASESGVPSTELMDESVEVELEENGMEAELGFGDETPPDESGAGSEDLVSEDLTTLDEESASLDMIPDDEDEPEEVSQGFYTVDGSDAGSEVNTDDKGAATGLEPVELEDVVDENTEIEVNASHEREKREEPAEPSGEETIFEEDLERTQFLEPLEDSEPFENTVEPSGTEPDQQSSAETETKTDTETPEESREALSADPAALETIKMDLVEDALDVVPDEDEEEEEIGQGFYTVTGDDAAAENAQTEIDMEPLKGAELDTDISENGDTSLSDEYVNEENEIVDAESVLPENHAAMETVLLNPDEATNESETILLEEAESGDDANVLDTIPEEDSDEETEEIGQGFYTVNGEDAVHEKSGEADLDLGGVEEVELNEPIQETTIEPEEGSFNDSSLEQAVKGTEKSEDYDNQYIAVGSAPSGSDEEDEEVFDVVDNPINTSIDSTETIIIDNPFIDTNDSQPIAIQRESGSPDAPEISAEQQDIKEREQDKIADVDDSFAAAAQTMIDADTDVLDIDEVQVSNPNKLSEEPDAEQPPAKNSDLATDKIVPDKKEEAELEKEEEPVVSSAEVPESSAESENTEETFDTSAADEHIASIPDHVLTPTLADIYFQQGQAELAIQIYKRLLNIDPENDRIVQRIDEIESTIAVENEDASVGVIKKRDSSMKSKEEGDTKQKKPKKAPAKRRKKRTRNPDAPLSKVKIKKKYRQRHQQKKSNK